MLRGNEAMMDTVSEKAQIGKCKDGCVDQMRYVDSDAEFEESEEKTEAAATLLYNDDGMVFHSAVYPQDIIGSTVFHIGLAGSAAESVPVTFVIPNSQIEEDFGGMRTNKF